MRLRLHAPDQPGIRKLKAYVKHRLDLELSRYCSQIGWVTVWLQSLDGTRGDRRCFLRAELVRGKDICLEVDASRMETAVDAAVARLGRAVRRALTPT